MKKLRLMSMLVFVPIVLGILMLILGTSNDNSGVAYAGMLMLTAGIPITMFILVVVGLVLMITGRLKLDDSTTSSVKKIIKDAIDEKANEAQNSDNSNDDEWEDYDADKDDRFDYAALRERNNDDQGESDDDDRVKTDTISKAVSSDNYVITDEGDEWEDYDAAEYKPQSERERERAQIADVNSSYGYSSKIKEAEYISRHTSDIYKNSSPKQKVLGWLFFGFLMADFALIMVFGFLHIFVGMIVCFCLFGGTILLAILITVIMQKISMMGAGKKGKGEALDGKVKTCFMSSSTSTGSAHTTRITSVVYKITVAVGDREYSAYSKTFYETGDSVKIVPRGKYLASIVEDDEEEDWDDL